MIEHYWMVGWDLAAGEEQHPETLPHPSVNAIFEKDKSCLFGVPLGKFTRTLEGRSHVFGVKFASGMFRPFLGYSVSKITNRPKPLADVFGEEIGALDTLLASEAPVEELFEAANRFFVPRIPAPDDKAELAHRLVRGILDDRDLLTVDDLARNSGLNKRALQRLFSEHVGVSPKWVIRRYRLHEAIERLQTGERFDFADLAADLGYFDQAHLIKDFKSMLGYTPGEFQKMR